MSTFDEIKILAGALREAGRGVMQATIGRELFFKEFAEITRQTGRPITWTALLANGDGSLSHRSMLERSRELMAQGLRIFPQVTCRPLNFEYNFKEPFILESLSLFKQVSAADFEGKMRIYGDPAFRRALAEVSKSGRFGLNWGRTTISYSPLQPELEERNLAKVAAERGADPVSVALDLAVATGLEARFRTQIMNYDEDEVAGLLKDRQTTVLGLSDAGAHASQLCDACYATYLLGHWVREKSAFTLEEAVRMLTSRPAEVFEIRDRGRLAPQWPADVVVFDPETVGASALRRTHDMPASAERLVSDAQGIKAVIVNGTIIRYENRDVVDLDGPLPGQVLRSRPAES